MHARGSLSAALLVLIIPHPVPSQAPVGQPLTAKVQETLMGPRSQRVYQSDDGDHLAIVTPKGSRQVVLLDGVEGPVFDEIPQNFSWSSYRGSGGSIVFSPTGGHSAYVARRAGDFIAVVDGKEAATLMTPTTIQGVTYGDPAAWSCAFNHDGTRLAYGARAGGGNWVIVADGVKSPVYRALDLNQTALNGKRLIYVAKTADGKWHAVVDGKLSPYYEDLLATGITSCRFIDDHTFRFYGIRAGQIYRITLDLGA
jgi:hypothetical protein